jgi:hypothetical protein
MDEYEASLRFRNIFPIIWRCVKEKDDFEEFEDVKNLEVVGEVSFEKIHTKTPKAFIFDDIKI